MKFTAIIIFSINYFKIASSLKYSIRSLLKNNQTKRKMSSYMNSLVMDDFCIRQFNNPSYTGTQVNYESITAFEDKVNEFYRNGTPLVDGYAPFWLV